MNKDEKAAVIDRVADQIQEASAIFAIDYRGISVKQVQQLRAQLGDADARFQIVKNRLTIRAADKAGAEELKELLEGPTAFTFVRGDAAVAAKAIATFRRQNGVLEFKGGTMDGEPVTIDEIESIARLPARDVLHGQFVGVLASPLTTLVRGLGSLIGGLAIQLQQIQEQGLAGGGADAEAEAASEEPAAEESEAEAPAEEAEEEPTAEAKEPQEEEQEETSEAPSEGEDQKPKEG
ncbi:MAG: 50S ribosomal protein L10 [Actinobacteria bacterium]|nr:MAG: 50S ribosomal protein L10 [Actinomycetota bacterium]